MKNYYIYIEKITGKLNCQKLHFYDKKLHAFIKCEKLEPLASYWFFAREACTIHFEVLGGEE